MGLYTVVSPISKDGLMYREGQTIELDDAQAVAMPWAVTPIVQPVEQHDAHAEIAEAPEVTVPAEPPQHAPHHAVSHASKKKHSRK